MTCLLPRQLTSFKIGKCSVCNHNNPTYIYIKDLNPSTPRSDLYVTSPYNIHTLSNRQVMRLVKPIS